MTRQGVEEHHEGKLWLYEQEQQRESAAALWHRAIVEEGSNAEWISFQKVQFGSEGKTSTLARMWILGSVMIKVLSSKRIAGVQNARVDELQQRLSQSGHTCLLSLCQCIISDSGITGEVRASENVIPICVLGQPSQ